jgi:hypothetical protein
MSTHARILYLLIIFQGCRISRIEEQSIERDKGQLEISKKIIETIAGLHGIPLPSPTPDELDRSLTETY